MHKNVLTKWTFLDYISTFKRQIHEILWECGFSACQCDTSKMNTYNYSCYMFHDAVMPRPLVLSLGIGTSPRAPAWHPSIQTTWQECHTSWIIVGLGMPLWLGQLFKTFCLCFLHTSATSSVTNLYLGKHPCLTKTSARRFLEAQKCSGKHSAIWISKAQSYSERSYRWIPEPELVLTQKDAYLPYSSPIEWTCALHQVTVLTALELELVSGNACTNCKISLRRCSCPYTNNSL